MRIAHFAIISFVITFLFAYEQFRDPYEVSKAERGRFLLIDKTTEDVSSRTDEVLPEQRIAEMHKQLDDLRLALQPMVSKAIDFSPFNLQALLETTWRDGHALANVSFDLANERISPSSIADEIGMQASVSATGMSLISGVHTSFGDLGNHTREF